MTETSDLIGQRKIRIEKAQKLRSMGMDPYVNKTNRTHKAKEIHDKFSELENSEVTVAGRLMSQREHGHLFFGNLQDQSGKIQLYIKEGFDTAQPDTLKKEVQNVPPLERGAGGVIGLAFDQLNLLDIGDIVEASGIVTKTQSGEVSVLVSNIRILAKAIRPLPSQWDGLKDKEKLFRQRYLDTVINPDKRQKFEYAAKIVFAIREFLNKKGFLEIQTPIIQPLYGGGTAKPFTTHVNALDEDYYLSISHELYLKRLITAGFENVYNINGYFRNEGIDRTHNPQFNMVETMTAFQNYEFNMNLMEEMYKYIGEKVFGKTNFMVNGQEIDFGKPWERIMMIDAVKKYAGYDFNNVKTVKEAHKILDEIGFEEEKPNSIGESMVKVFEEKVEEHLIHPTFVFGHPVEISPLAKRIPDNPKFVERFEIFIGGIEGGDNWTELNDPLELYERFKDQVEKGRRGSEEFHPMDVDFLETMEYGMPPTTGVGPGIERLIMMFTDSQYIDDVIFFPMMKPAKPTEIQKELYGEEFLEQSAVSSQPSASTNSPSLVSPGDGRERGSGRVITPNSEPQTQNLQQDFSNKIVIVVNNEIENWQKANTVGHISAYLGNKLNNQFATGENFVTKDGKAHPRNSQYAIVVLSANPGQMANFMEKVRESGLTYHGFIKEMIDTTNDAEIINILKDKSDQEINYLGIGLFGPNEKLKELTKKFSLFK